MYVKMFLDLIQTGVGQRQNITPSLVKMLLNWTGQKHVNVDTPGRENLYPKVWCINNQMKIVLWVWCEEQFDLLYKKQQLED